MADLIYHVTTKDAWKSALQQNCYTATSLYEEGFIHCSEEHQVEVVLKRYFAGKTGLLKLTIDTRKLNAKLQYDLSDSVNEKFPHIYGRINLNAIIAITEI